MFEHTYKAFLKKKNENSNYTIIVQRDIIRKKSKEEVYLKSCPTSMMKLFCENS